MEDSAVVAVVATGVALQDQGAGVTAITFDQPCQLTKGSYTISIQAPKASGCSVRSLPAKPTVKFMYKMYDIGTATALMCNPIALPVNTDICNRRITFDPEISMLVAGWARGAEVGDHSVILDETEPGNVLSVQDVYACESSDCDRTRIQLTVPNSDVLGTRTLRVTGPCTGAESSYAESYAYSTGASYAYSTGYSTGATYAYSAGTEMSYAYSAGYSTGATYAYSTVTGYSTGASYAYSAGYSTGASYAYSTVTGYSTGASY
eukprot:3941877-Rhodomonas_salina.1